MLREAVSPVPLCSRLAETNAQRASNTLAPSSMVSSVLHRHYCCSGSTLSRQYCVFCGLWHHCLPRQLLLPFWRVHMLTLIKQGKEKTDTFCCPASPPVLHSLLNLLLRLPLSVYQENKHIFMFSKTDEKFYYISSDVKNIIIYSHRKSFQEWDLCGFFFDN